MTRAEEITSVTEQLNKVWLERPDLSLMELISGTHADAFNPKFWGDGELIDNLKKTYEVKK